MARGDLSNAEWAVLEPMLPAQAARGGQWRDHRQVVNAICWIMRTGSPWRDLPERYGPWKTAYQRFRRWAADGTWAMLKKQVIALAEADGDIDWDAQIDSTIVRVHQHAAGARKGGSTPTNPSTGAAWPPASTNWPATTEPHSTSSRLWTGYAPCPTDMIRETEPRPNGHQISIRRCHHGRSHGANGSLTVRATTRSSIGSTARRSSRRALPRRYQIARSNSVLT
ncbi:IS5 family transposase [Hamadaea flava]|uniref:IS5 family transposase n=1 Tax=Hamadaea flava TaxID=1742688 RepID=A0ABV8LFE4_9ACTN|nr:IS5 family transposase [Hamadaea flava]